MSMMKTVYQNRDNNINNACAVLNEETGQWIRTTGLPRSSNS